MNESHTETAFLVGVVSYDDTAEGGRLKASVAQAEQDERCVRRALRLPVVLVLLAIIGLGYWEVFLSQRASLSYDFSSVTWRGRLFIANGLLGLGLGSLFSVLVLLVLATVYHKQAGKRRRECRRFAAQLLEARLGKRPARPLSGDATGHKILLNLSDQAAAVVPTSDCVSPAEPLMEAPGSSDLLKRDEPQCSI